MAENEAVHQRCDCPNLANNPFALKIVRRRGARKALRQSDMALARLASGVLCLRSTHSANVARIRSLGMVGSVCSGKNPERDTDENPCRCNRGALSSIRQAEV